MTFRPPYLFRSAFPPNNPITACGATSFPGYHSFPKWAMFYIFSLPRGRPNIIKLFSYSFPSVEILKKTNFWKKSCCIYTRIFGLLSWTTPDWVNSTVLAALLVVTPCWVLVNIDVPWGSLNPFDHLPVRKKLSKNCSRLIFSATNCPVRTPPIQSMAIAPIATGINDRLRTTFWSERGHWNDRAIVWSNLVLSTGLIMWIGHRKEIGKLTFRVLALRRFAPRKG